MIRLRIRTFLRFRFAAILRMAAAGPAEFIYNETFETIKNSIARDATTAKPCVITAAQLSTSLKWLYKDIPEEFWVNNYAKIHVPPKFYVKREKNPDRIQFNQIFGIPLSQQAARQAVQQAVASGPAGVAIPGAVRRPNVYMPPSKGGKNRRTKRRHNKKRQTKRRR